MLVADSDGAYIKTVTNRKRIPGKYGRHALCIRVASRSEKDKELLVEGSPFANHYGQNVWSRASVKLACTSTVQRLIRELNISATPDTVAAWNSGEIELHRVDLAVNFRLDSKQQVDEVLTQLKRQLIATRLQCSIHARYAALCPRNSKQYRIAAYDKGAQLALKSSGDHDNDSFRRLVAECESILRIEVRLLRPELQKLGLTLARDWKPETSRDVFRQYFARLPLHDVSFGPLSSADFDDTAERMRPILALHKFGADWKQIYSERTRTRHRAYFKERGINLDCPNVPGPPISLADVLSTAGIIAKTPQWLIEAGMAPQLKRKQHHQVATVTHPSPAVIPSKLSSERKGTRLTLIRRAPIRADQLDRREPPA